MTKKRRLLRPLPVLTPGQKAFHAGITANREVFSLEAVLARHAGAVRLRPLTEAQHAVIAKAAPRQRGKVISSIPDIAAPANTTDTQSRHVTPTGGNVSVDLGFPPEEAERLLAEADKRLELKDDSPD
ncbi:MAG: hypothetical protein Q7K57_48590 [Burkholderiaceae bacterium]|nr:hypothetical protein [Burkholderiaceae bacterium]